MKVRLVHPSHFGLLIGALIGMPQSVQGIDATALRPPTQALLAAPAQGAPGAEAPAVFVHDREDAESGDSRGLHHPQLARAEEAGFRPWSPSLRGPTLWSTDPWSLGRLDSIPPSDGRLSDGPPGVGTPSDDPVGVGTPSVGRPSDGRLSFVHPALVPMRAWVRRANPPAALQRPILVVIESDGARWRYGGRVPPEDPTPRNPIGLQMAMAAPADMQVLYFARPCQFLRKPLARYSACADSQWWTDKRFSPGVVEAYAAGVAQFLAEAQSPGPRTHAQTPFGEKMLPEASPPGTLPQLILAGFSGGGTLALRVASQWPQFLSSAHALCLISLAAPLDLHAWTSHHRLRPVHGAVPGAPYGAAPLDEDFSLLAEALKGIRAHFAFGASDRIVPLQSAGRFATHPAWQHALHHYPGLGHDDSWLKVWPTLLSKAC